MLHCFRVSHRIRILILLFAVQLSAEAWSPGQLRGESPLLLLAQVTPGTQTPSGTNVSQAELDSLASDARRAASGPKPSNPPPKTEGMNFLTLLVRGGWFMVPIGVVSLIVVAVGLERSIMLRNSRMIPQGLIRSMGALARESEVLDPKAAYRLCQQFPSSAANVIRTMLLKVGRPHSEVETAIRESTQREADRAYAGVRWLSLSAGIAPLLGLLGTVWGLMRSFHDLGQIGPSQNRGQYLAQGIYEALITTLGGLIVAITASFLRITLRERSKPDSGRLRN